MEKNKIISNWKELSECTSPTHILIIDLDTESGSIYKEINGELERIHYLSTHSFFESNYKYSTKILQECGFNVQLIC